MNNWKTAPGLAGLLLLYTIPQTLLLKKRRRRSIDPIQNSEHLEPEKNLESRQGSPLREKQTPHLVCASQGEDSERPSNALAQQPFSHHFNMAEAGEKKQLIPSEVTFLSPLQISSEQEGIGCGRKVWRNKTRASSIIISGKPPTNKTTK